MVTLFEYPPCKNCINPFNCTACWTHVVIEDQVNLELLYYITIGRRQKFTRAEFSRAS